MKLRKIKMRPMWIVDKGLVDPKHPQQVNWRFEAQFDDKAAAMQFVNRVARMDYLTHWRVSESRLVASTQDALVV